MGMAMLYGYHQNYGDNKQVSLKFLLFEFDHIVARFSWQSKRF